jgi:sugar lactone lactonase YvrE
MAATRKNAAGSDPMTPRILEVNPPACIPGGEFRIRGAAFTTRAERPAVSFGEVPAHLVVGSSSYVVVRVPEGAASAGQLVIDNRERTSEPYVCDIGVQIADGLHPVSSPAVDSMGNVYATLSGSRGQKTPVAVYKIDLNYAMRPFVPDLMNATGLAFDRDGLLYVSSRYDGVVYQVTPAGNMSVFVEGMGVATGITFDGDGNLYVGDRSGTIFKVAPDRQIFVFATMEQSISAYHLAFGPDGYLYVTGPTTSSFDTVHRVSPAGEVEIFYRGLGRPQGLAFDSDGRLYVAASFSGSRGVVRIDESRKAELFVSGPNIVGLAFSPSRSMMVATNNAVYRLDVHLGPLRLW